MHSKVIGSVLKVLSLVIIVLNNITSGNVDYSKIKYQSGNSYLSPTTDSGKFGGKAINAFSTPVCKTLQPCRDPITLPRNVSRTLLKTSRLFYMTMGSCYGYSLVAEVLLARKVRNYQELYEMCPSIFVKSTGESYTSGYGHQYAQTCFPSPTNTLVRDCIELEEGTDPKVDMTLLNVLSPTAIATDDKTYMLFYRCINRRFEDYILFTTTPYIKNTNVMKEVIEKIREFGFSEKEILLWPCQIPTFAHPFQNYLFNSAKCPKDGKLY